MRILYVIGGYGEEHLGGAIHRELAQAILGQGHSWEIFAPTHARDMGGRGATDLDEGVRVHRAVCAGRPLLDIVNAVARPVFRFPWFATSLAGLLRVLRSNPPYDVVVAESAFPLGAETWLATRLHRVPFVVSVYGGDFIANEDANYGYARYRLARSFMVRTFRAAALVRTVSPYAARHAEALGCPPEKLAVVQRNIARGCFIPTGTTPSAFRAEARSRVARAFPLMAPRLVVAVGRLVPIKGFDDLIRALPALIASAGDTQVLVAGPNRGDSRLGDYQKHLEGLAASLGVASRVVFAGPLAHERVRDCLAAADAVAIPSVEEGGSKMVMEAAAVGTPFVATSAAGTTDWAEAWRCGVVVEPQDPAALAGALADVLKDPASAAAMGERGRLFAERFRPEAVAERIVALCSCAVSGLPLPPWLLEPLELLNPPIPASPSAPGTDATSTASGRRADGE